MKLTPGEKEVWLRYRSPQGAVFRRQVNAVHISPANSLKHELKKAEVCYGIRSLGKHFITEAICKKTNRRVDIVDLSEDLEIEIETTEKRAARFKGMKNVMVVMTE